MIKKKWSQLKGNTKNDNVWNNLTRVQVLKVHNGELFAGINNSVWKLNKDSK